MEFGPTVRNLCLIQVTATVNHHGMYQIKGQPSTKPCSVPQNVVENPPQSSPKNVKRLSERSVRADFDLVLFQEGFSRDNVPNQPCSKITVKRALMWWCLGSERRAAHWKPSTSYYEKNTIPTLFESSFLRAAEQILYLSRAVSVFKWRTEKPKYFHVMLGVETQFALVSRTNYFITKNTTWTRQI